MEKTKNKRPFENEYNDHYEEGYGEYLKLFGRKI